jgi:hypothetical protein
MLLPFRFLRQPRVADPGHPRTIRMLTLIQANKKPRDPRERRFRGPKIASEGAESDLQGPAHPDQSVIECGTPELASASGTKRLDYGDVGF